MEGVDPKLLTLSSMKRLDNRKSLVLIFSCFSSDCNVLSLILCDHIVVSSHWDLLCPKCWNSCMLQGLKLIPLKRSLLCMWCKLLVRLWLTSTMMDIKMQNIMEDIVSGVEIYLHISFAALYLYAFLASPSTYSPLWPSFMKFQIYWHAELLCQKNAWKHFGLTLQNGEVMAFHSIFRYIFVSPCMRIEHGLLKYICINQIWILVKLIWVVFFITVNAQPLSGSLSNFHVYTALLSYYKERTWPLSRPNANESETMESPHTLFVV